MEWLSRKISKFENHVEYLTEEQIIEFSELIVVKMDDLKVTRAELARRLGVSKPFVTKMFNGNSNMTIKTMVSVANALDCRLNIDIYPKGFDVARKALYVYDNKGYKPFAPAIDEANNACAA